MLLGLIRDPDPADPVDAKNGSLETIALADCLGLRQVQLCARDERDLDLIIEMTERIRIGLGAARLNGRSPGAKARDLRAMQDRAGGRLVLGLPSDTSPGARREAETLETLVSEPGLCPLSADLPTDPRFPIAPPRPEILGLPVTGTPQEAAASAALGRLILSPAWITPQALSWHWPAIVAGATHARRRVHPAHWHVARCVMVSDDPDAIARFTNGPVRAYLMRCGVAETDLRRLLPHLVIAGPAARVASAISRMRNRVGPFGVLHCIDPGGDAAPVRETLTRMVRDVLPALDGNAPDRARQMEPV